MDLRTKAIEKIVRQLKNLNCEFMIVPDGDIRTAVTHGKFSYHKKVAHGAYTKHVEGYLINMKPGESVVIPVGDYPLDTIQSVVSAYAFRTFGKGNYISARTEDGKGVELLCLDRDDPQSDQLDGLRKQIDDMLNGED